MMKSNQLKLSIDQPCSTNWDAMNANDGNKKFCTSCNKAVTDFTTMADDELIRFMLKNKAVCGRLTDDQLNRTFDIYPKKESTFKLTQLLLLPSFLLSIPGFAQQIKEKQVASTVIVPQKNTADPQGNRMITINGNVQFQNIYNDSLQPIRTVVLITNGRDSVSKFSGLDGNYSIAISCFDTDSITISAWENGTDEFKTTLVPQVGIESFHLDIFLHLNIPAFKPEYITSIGGIQASIGIPMSRTRSFFYRLFHPFRFLKFK
ncbi:MAG: hypothetical protein ABIQ40_02780 [Bacteroidia bacterium]